MKTATDPTSIAAQPEPSAAVPLSKLVESYGDAFSRRGDHAMHARLHDVVIQAASLKRAIATAALGRSTLPPELVDALDEIAAVL